jgi:hypothetical protein
VCSNRNDNTRDTSPMSVVSFASLEALNRLSPVSDTPSLEKFLSTPASEDPVSAAVLSTAILDTPPERSISRFSGWRMPGSSQSQTFNSAPLAPRRPLSVAHSASSASSVHIFQSWRTARSNDSRGSRRGRKGWTRYDSGKLDHKISDENLVRVLRFQDHSFREYNQTDPPLVLPTEDAEDDRLSREAAAATYLERFFCTWPSCSSRFQYRYDWSRHEEALHYCPFHWVCCCENTQAGDSMPCLICSGYRNDHTATQHCGSCLTKDVQSRTFLREDQLAQHIKRAHFPYDDAKPKISKELLSAWKIDNPSFSNDFLRCGFCGLVSDTWVLRQSHVHDHLKRGVCKSSWWSQREPEGYHVSTE